MRIIERELARDGFQMIAQIDHTLGDSITDTPEKDHTHFSAVNLS